MNGRHPDKNKDETKKKVKDAVKKGIETMKRWFGFEYRLSFA